MTKLDHIKQIINQLPLAEGWDKAVSGKDPGNQVDEAAKKLSRALLWGSSKEEPHHYKMGSKKAARQLDKLGKALVKAAELFPQLSSEAINALRFEIKGHAPENVYTEMFILFHAANRAAMSLQCRITYSTKHEKIAAAFVAYEALRVLENLTGRKASITVHPDGRPASGVYITFVQQLFEAMEVDASPEWHCKAAIKKHRRIEQRMKEKLEGRQKWRGKLLL